MNILDHYEQYRFSRLSTTNMFNRMISHISSLSILLVSQNLIRLNNITDIMSHRENAELQLNTFFNGRIQSLSICIHELYTMSFEDISK